MDNLLFIACVNLDDRASGITRKVLSQFKTINSQIPSFLLGYLGDDLALVSSDGETRISSNGRHRRIAMMDESINLIKKLNIRYVYIRRFPCNPLVLNMLKKINKHGALKIVWEIPTYPYDYEFQNSMKYRLIGDIDKITRISLKKYIDRIVTFSNENTIFGIKTICTGNGIEVDSIRERKIIEHGDIINLIAVAVLNNWHGYDRIITGLSNYRGKRKVVLHIVGGGPCFEEYYNLTKNLGISENVIFYGPKTKEEIDDIYDKADMAIESLGWHRSHVTVGTSLKTREYIAKGLPIVASTPMDIFPDGWEYAYYASIDDSPIDIDEVVRFYDKIISNRDKQELAREIRQFAYQKCDMKVMMKPIVDFFVDD